MQLKKRIPGYIIGLFVLALGIVLIKKAALGISPNSSIPAAVSNITPLTLGNTTILFHFLCIILTMLLLRKVDLKTLMLFPLAFAFGYIIDLYVFLLSFDATSLWIQFILLLAGIVCTALGIDIIVGAGLLLPGPDALIQAASKKFDRPLGTVKIIGDVSFVLITVLIELVTSKTIVSVGIGTVVSMFLTGKFISWIKKWLPWLEMPPLHSAKTTS